MASTTQGQQLEEEELGRMEDTCDTALVLRGAKLHIYKYVESHMSFITPNLSLILGASTAAKMVRVEGPDPTVQATSLKHPPAGGPDGHCLASPPPPSCPMPVSPTTATLPGPCCRI